MPYLPTIDMTSQIYMLLGRGALRILPGQWVRGEKGRGRYLRTDPRTGVTYVSWMRPGDDWRTAADRFRRACRKGFVGRYRPLYRAEKERRMRERAAPAHGTEAAWAAGGSAAG